MLGLLELVFLNIEYRLFEKSCSILLNRQLFQFIDKKIKKAINYI